MSFSLEVIRNYSIKYRANDRNGIWRTKTSLKLVAVLLKLSPYTEYSVMVTAHTDRGPGQTSSAVFARTKSGSKCVSLVMLGRTRMITYSFV